MEKCYARPFTMSSFLLRLAPTPASPKLYAKAGHCERFISFCHSCESRNPSRLAPTPVVDVQIPFAPVISLTFTKASFILIIASLREDYTSDFTLVIKVHTFIRRKSDEK